VGEGFYGGEGAAGEDHAVGARGEQAAHCAGWVQAEYV
jgi:hypothetical protein